MNMIESIQASIHSLTLPILLILGLTILLSYYVGKSAQLLRLPSLIGFMIMGVVLGPSVLDVLTDTIQEDLSFITEIALGFVGFTIGLELSIASFKRQGIGILSIILAESFGAFIMVSLGVYVLTRDLSLSLIFGAMAPASAPAGTVAVIKEFNAKGNLTRALYSVVGLDDGLAIIIFGFAAAFARNILLQETGTATSGMLASIFAPLKEVSLSIIIGLIIAIILGYLIRKLRNKRESIILIFGFILLINGLCTVLHLSLILTNMILGSFIVNTQKHSLTQNISDQLSDIMSILFILFFSFAGAHLHIRYLPSLGVIALVYIICRSFGKIVGARAGTCVGRIDEKVKKYIGMGILSQAGVAIGLALIVKHEFSGIGKVIRIADGKEITTGDHIGMVILTTITVTCIFFEIIGPILTKIALQKAGEIEQEDRKGQD